MSFVMQDEREKIQVNNVRTKKGDTLTDPPYNKIIMRLSRSYANKF